MDMNRRTFVAGAAAAGVAAAAMGSMAHADEAAEAAGAWDAQPASVADQVSSSADYDIVVVGGGNSGVVAGLHAAQLGAKVLIVEQSASVCMWAGDIDALDSQIQKDMGIDIDKEWVIEDLLRYNQGKCDVNLIRQWAYNAGALVDWYTDVMRAGGADVMVDTRCKRFFPENVFYSPASVHTAYQPPLMDTKNSMGSEIAMPIMLAQYAELGGEIMYFTKAVELVQPEGPGTPVTGVICQLEDESYAQFNAAKCVMLATGGFSGNKDMMDQLNVQAHKFCSNHLGGDGRNGDGIKMAVWAGGEMDHDCAGSCNIFDRGCITGNADNGNIGWDKQGGGDMRFWWPGSQPFLRVNQFGKRYCNEDGPYDIAFNLAMNQPGGWWWQVFDASSWDDVVSFGTTICSRVVAEPGAKNCFLLGQFFPCRNAEEWQEVYIEPNVANGVLIKADTLEELADMMEFDEQAKADFLATVERYNECATAGWDYDYGKAPFRLSNIDEGPFYACKLAGWLLSTLSGVRVDNTYTVLTPEGKRIEGLKAIGLDHGGFFNGMYAQYYGGINMSHNLMAGWLGVKAAMGEPYPVQCFGPDHAYAVDHEE